MIFSGLFAKPDPNAPSGDISFDDLQRALQEGSVALVDVREPHEFAAGHVPGAVSLPLSRFRPGDLPKGKPLVLICQAGGRSAKALHQAAAAGVADVRHYPGGTSGWRSLAYDPDHD